ncbi:MAG: DNA polymerase I [Cyclonatronaceae bacterium]
MNKPRLFLLDGHALAYRSYFAFINANLRNSEGIPTGPVLGFANTVVKLIEAEKPTHIAVAWDSHGPTFRHELDENYKAHRPPQPEDLQITIPLMKEFLANLHIQNLEKPGYEADDIIGTLAVNAGGEGADVYMVTPDKDFMQLVNDGIRMLKPLNNGDGFDLIDASGVEKYFGVGPDKVIDVLAIIGDTSDNIPGVPGIGKKGAPAVIKEYGSLEAAIEAAPGIKSKRVREGLMNNADQARLSRKMIVIETSVPDTVNWQELVWKNPDEEATLRFLRRMEFNSLATRLFGEKVQQTLPRSAPHGQADLFSTGSGASAPADSFDRLEDRAAEYTLISTKEELEKLAGRLAEAPVISFDTETTGTDPMLATLVGISLSVKSDEAWYIQLGEQGIPVDAAVDLLTPLLNNELTTKVAQNFKYDYIMLYRNGLEVRGPVFDTMVAGYLIDAAQKLSMDALSRKYLNYDPVSIETLIGSGKKQLSMAEIDPVKVSNYACEDADVTFRLYEVLSNQLQEDGLLEVASEIEFPLIKVLARMEMEGMAIDEKMLAGFSEQLGSDMLALEQEIYSKAGAEFNINSPQQLGDILFNKLKLPSGRKTKGGQFSTSEEVLSDLAVTYELPGLILDYRSLSKLKSTYVDALPKLMHPETGRIHTSFNQTIAATGRLSSSSPNLQNIPIRTERGREIRRAFIARKGYKLLAADYSQIELRVIASIANETAMKAAFNDGEDIHARTAKEIFSLGSIDEVDREQRRKAKEVNFGIPYGVSAFGLSQRLGVSRDEGKSVIEAYFGRFPEIRKYISETVDFARQYGYVKTLSGRRRYIRDINSGNVNVRGFAERTAINTPIQGTAADLIKIAMIRISDYLETEALKTRMVLQVHDELLFEVPSDELETVPEVVREIMENAMDIGVPLNVETGLGDNWLEAH